MLLATLAVSGVSAAESAKTAAPFDHESSWLANSGTDFGRASGPVCAAALLYLQGEVQLNFV